jgi:hypothetical protein
MSPYGGDLSRSRDGLLESKQLRLKTRPSAAKKIPTPSSCRTSSTSTEVRLGDQSRLRVEHPARQKKIWDKLSPDEQKMIGGAIAETRDYQREQTRLEGWPSSGPRG